MYVFSQVDKAAVMLMTDKELVDMGILAKGDRLKLQAFCRREKETKDETKVEKMRRLKQIIESGRSSKDTKSTKSKATVSLKFEVRWKHYQEGKGYKLKRAEQGGGVRSISIPRNATAEDCLELLQDVFFPNGRCPIGSLSDFNLHLADFKGETLDLFDKFTAEDYKKKHGLHTPRLCLHSKDKEYTSLPLSVSSDESDDDYLTKSPFYSHTSTDPKSVKSTSSTITEDPSVPSILDKSSAPEPTNVKDAIKDPKDGLIGNSEERKQMMAQIQQDYDTSLKADKIKDLKRKEEDAAQARQESLRQRREMRLLSIPSLQEPHVVVRVQHSNLGVINRSFPANCKVMAVYDWVGSLSTIPEHFTLTLVHPQSVVYPDEDISSVVSSMLYMSGAQEPISLSRDDDEVEFFNGRPDYQFLDTISSTPPDQLMEEDASQENSRFIDSLKTKREFKEQQLKEDVLIKIDRHNCVKEMLKVYEKEDIINCRLCLIFKDEDGYGDGARREVYSSFWDNFVSQYCEGASNFAFSVSAAISPESYVAMGRILTHQFIQTGTLPLQISEATIQQAVFGDVPEECLINSFLMLLQEKERDVITRAMSGAVPFPSEEVIDILSEYNATTYPRSTNIRQVVLQVALTELISKPFMCITKLREGMGNFWENISSDEIHALYAICSPTPENVVKCLDFASEDAKGTKVTRWLVRYLKNKDQKTICRFLRFCTGSDLVLPGQTIKVHMQNMAESSIRPKAQTCFRVLTISKNYRTFAYMADNFDFYRNNVHI